MSDNYFLALNSVNVNEKVEKKNGLSYLSWAYAWGEIKKADPSANYTVYENANGWNYHTDGNTAWVKTGVTVNGIEHIEYLPVMDHRNNSIPVEKVTSFDVNKTIQRSLTKACARHGLGLYIYAGEDLPEGEETKAEPKPKAEKKAKAEPKAEPTESEDGYLRCEDCGNIITSWTSPTGKVSSPEEIARLAKKKTGRQLCLDCARKAQPV